jgi:hypothetical protein
LWHKRKFARGRAVEVLQGPQAATFKHKQPIVTHKQYGSPGKKTIWFSRNEVNFVGKRMMHMMI